MNIIEIVVALLFAATVTAALVPRLKIPYEALLLLGSLLLGFIPGLPRIALNPNVVFFLFLPPILFAAAYFTSWRDFKANARPISLLAVGLVLFTTACVAVIMKMIIPGMSWAVACVLGAMISPPDASAATSITKKLGVPRRLQTIIEGESLVNDATALVIYRISISAAMTGAFSLTQGIFQFLWVGAGGVLVGMAVGALSIWFYNRLPDTKADILLSFLTAFLAYSLAERLHVSGVISTVAAGLYFGRVIPVSGSADVRVQAEATWDLMLFVINGLVFTLIGLQLPSVVHGLKDIPLSDLVFYTAILNILVFITRFLWVFPATYVPRWISRGLATRDPAPSWRVVTALGYTGMRGIVSLAAALSLPIVIPSGEVFPFRDLLIFLTYTVILTTLLLPSLTLPTLLRWLKIKATDEAYREEMTARLASATAVLRAYNDLSKNPRYLEHHLKQVEQRYRKHITTYQSNLTDQPFSELFDEDQKLRMLMKEIIQIERKALVDLRVKAAIHDEVFHMLSREIDLEELRLKTHRI